MNIFLSSLYLIFIDIDEVKVTSWIDFELYCVLSSGVLLTPGIGFQYECNNGYFHLGGQFCCTFYLCTYIGYKLQPCNHIFTNEPNRKIEHI